MIIKLFKDGRMDEVEDELKKELMKICESEDEARKLCKKVKEREDVQEALKKAANAN